MDEELERLDREAESAFHLCDTHWATCAKCSRGLVCGTDQALRSRYVATERKLADARAREAPRLVVLR